MASNSTSSRRSTQRWALVAAGAALLLLALEPPAQQWLRLQVFDAYQRVLPRARVSAPAVIVAIDEASLARYGQWPWPRTRLADIVGRVAAAGPAAIGIDIFMPEPDRLSPRRMVENVPDLEAALAARIRALPDTDERLAAAMRGQPVVLGLASAVWTGASGGDRPLPAAPMLLRGDPAGTQALMAFDPAGMVRSVATIEAAAAGHGLLNAPIEAGLVHRVPLLSRVGEVLLPTLAVELWRVAARIPAIEAQFDAHGLVRARVGDLALPAARDGTLWLRYGRFDPARYVSAEDVLEGRVAPERFARRLVLIAVTGLGLLDQIGTPLDPRVPGIEVHAQVLENLYDHSWLTRPAWARVAEFALLALAALLAMLLLPRLAPRRGFALFGALLLGMAAAGLGAFGAGFLIDVLTPSLGATLVFTAVIGASLSEAQRQRRELGAQLQAEREVAARVAGEMEAARRVQTGMLPDPRERLADEPRLSIASWMEPAREVGGDLYDLFALDAQRWCVLIGDVSGKGLPAALFMALVKAQCQAALLREPRALDRALAQAEAELVRNNPESMFVTLLVLVIDLRDGSVEFCNAGHEPPLQLGGDAALAIDDAGRPPLGALDAGAFPLGRFRLQPGACLCLVTDGVTEAMDRSGELYGRERLAQLLGGEQRDPAAIIASLREDLARHAAGAEPADDIAVLVLRWNGEGAATGR